MIGNINMNTYESYENPTIQDYQNCIFLYVSLDCVFYELKISDFLWVFTFFSLLHLQK